MWQKLKHWAQRVEQEIDVYRRVLAHAHTPWYAKAVLGLALAYFVLPIDLIPDPIPVLGQLDDLLIVPGLIWLALKLIPPQIVTGCREEAQQRASE
ncbi:MAG: DUF1232 domain-containing protein [Chloroflexi bacterium]|nr:DUF1232 domain-containing protein [Chloroflexota bacterium]